MSTPVPAELRSVGYFSIRARLPANRERGPWTSTRSGLSAAYGRMILRLP